MISVVGRTVYLTTDLTRYDPSLVDGTKGVIVNDVSRRGDAFADVRFAKAGVLPILWRSMYIEPYTEKDVDKILSELADDVEDSGLIEKATQIRALLKSKKEETVGSVG